MKNNGFTLIELLAIMVILAVLSLITVPIITGIVNSTKKNSFENATNNLISVAEQGYHTIIIDGSAEETTYTYTNGVQALVSGNINITYNGKKPQNGTMIINNNGEVALALYNDKYCASKSFSDEKIVIEEKLEADCIYEYSITKGVNVPKLSKGMVPIKWDGSKWIETTASDSDWYDYSTDGKKWANAESADGSMWVWIPRYIYKISSGWHTNTVGTIEVQFSKGTNDNWNSSVIGNINTDTTANASNNTWTNHPGFTFGSTELTGMWISKFEASGTTSSIDIKPNLITLRQLSMEATFTACRNMETNSKYGWGTAGTNIDTHLMKNTEWGAVAYLTKSTYGQGSNEVWINNDDKHTTGCAGTGVSVSGYNGCQNSYETTNGVKASTTGNIYGIYDMSGGGAEYMASYINNGNASLTTYGPSVLSADNKYKDIYQVTTDDSATNYSNAISKKGDAIYETSGAVTMGSSWYGDYSGMANNTAVWFIRGGQSVSTTYAGIFAFVGSNGSDSTVIVYRGFRPALMVGTGL